MIADFFAHVFSIINGPYFLIVIETISLSLKIILLTILLNRGSRIFSTALIPWILIICVLISAMFTNVAWLVNIAHKIYQPGTKAPPIILFIIRISWGLVVIQYQSLALFIESLTEKFFKPGILQKFFICITILFFTGFFFAGISAFFNLPTSVEFVKILQKYCAFFSIAILFPPLAFVLLKLPTKQAPQILKKQLKVFILFIICPYMISDLLALFIANSVEGYATVSISTALLTYALYYAMRKMMRLRFLNHQGHVQSQYAFSFIGIFQDVLERLSHVTDAKELKHITQSFFKYSFNISLGRTNLHIRTLSSTDSEKKQELSRAEAIVENFIMLYNSPTPLKKSKILITDELEFSNFYENKEKTAHIIRFLKEIDADVFIPIYEKDTICAYIIVDHDARKGDFYSNVERDEMILFASYLGNIINLLQNKNLTTVIEQEKQLQEELYAKHQEINQYKESIRSFLRNSKTQETGIIFYKNRSFIYGNQAAQELISININTQIGHPLTKAIKEIARQVKKYKSAQSCVTTNAEGERIVISGIPNLERNNVIITISYPEISDIIKQQIDLLKDPSVRDYLLYLETTKSGQLINQLIPGTGENLLMFKIALLKTALSRKAILLDMPEEDLLSTVEIIHHISLRDTLHVLKLQTPTTTMDVAIKLFGINPTFGNNQDRPLLEKLDNIGTLFIQNVHLLDLESQNHLAEFIRYGFYRIFKSDQKAFSDVRIITSTNQNLKTAMQKGTFSKALYNELNKTSLSLPSLLTLSEQELTQLVDGFSKQAVNTPTFNNLLELTEQEKTKLIKKGLISLKEFKTHIQNLLIAKSKKNNIYQETHFDPAYHITDPELIEAARLGKHALRDPKIMAILWNKFKSQNKIATFLGVNRSSIHRRIKEYKLID